MKKINSLLILVLVAVLSIWAYLCMDLRGNRPIMTRQMDYTDAWISSVWTGTPETICLGGIEYIYLHKARIGGLAPKHSEGRVHLCADDRFPESLDFYDYYQICYHGAVYHQFTNIYGTTLAGAINVAGKPVACDSEGVMQQEQKRLQRDNKH